MFFWYNTIQIKFNSLLVTRLKCSAAWAHPLNGLLLLLLVLLHTFEQERFGKE